MHATAVRNATMSEDLRNSIIAWVSVAAFFLFVWAIIHFDVPNIWIWQIVGTLWAIRLVFYLVRLWRRRAAGHRLSRGSGAA